MELCLPTTVRYPSRVPSRNPTARIIRCGIAEPSGVPAPMGQKTQYKDGGRAGGRGETKWYDYESFVDVSRKVMQGRSRTEQQRVVREVLLSMLPPGAPAQFRKLFPPTKWAAEFNASLTVPFFHWLVGPSEVIEVEVNGVKQRSGVHIKKCSQSDYEDSSLQGASPFRVLENNVWTKTNTSEEGHLIVVLNSSDPCFGNRILTKVAELPILPAIMAGAHKAVEERLSNLEHQFHKKTMEMESRLDRVDLSVRDLRHQ
ncbi:hypothetical protein ACLOJK_006291 [Asimina triloba]